MSFILEDGNFTVSSGNRTLYTTTRKNPHIVSKISGSTTISNLTVYAGPRIVTGTAWITALYFAATSRVLPYRFSQIPDFYNAPGKFFVLPFFKSTLQGDPTSSSNPGDTGGKWIYSPGGAVFRIYALKGYATPASGAFGQNDTPTGYMGALTVNILLSPPGYEGYLTLVFRNHLAGHTLAPGGSGMFPAPTQSGFSYRDINSLYTDASIDYIIYIGRF